MTIEAAEFQLYVADEHVTYAGYQYYVMLHPGKTGVMIDMWDQLKPAWKWRLRLSDLTELDDASRPGWAYVTAAVEGPDGSLYGPFRPFVVYTKPWIHPTVMVWPDAWCGAIVLTMRVIGELPKPVDPSRSFVMG